MVWYYFILIFRRGTERKNFFLEGVKFGKEKDIFFGFGNVEEVGLYVILNFRIRS